MISGTSVKGLPKVLRRWYMLVVFLGEYQARRNKPIDSKTIEKLFVEEFPWWLQQQVKTQNECDEEVLSLAMGPNTYVRQYKALIINGFRFHTKRREEFRKTQNSGVIVGVIVEADKGNYYGKLTDIIELDYFNYKVVLFRCDWVDIRPSRGLKKDKYGFPLVNFSKPLIHTGEALKDDPFIISSQSKQVFYVEDPNDAGWSHVIMTKPRDTYDMGANVNANDDDELFTQCAPYNLPILDDVNETPTWCRTDIEMGGSSNSEIHHLDNKAATKSSVQETFWTMDAAFHISCEF